MYLIYVCVWPVYNIVWDFRDTLQLNSYIYLFKYEFRDSYQKNIHLFDKQHVVSPNS